MKHKRKGWGSMSVTGITLYEKIGGKEKLEEALHHFHRLLLADEELAPFFVDRDMAKHLEQQLNFITRVTGGPTTCNCKCGKGNHAQKVMEKSHSELSINEDQYVRFMDLLLLGLEEAEIPTEAIYELAGELGKLKEFIIKG